MATNNLIAKIRKWPIEKKRIFSISVALFFTILIIILNFSITSFWKEEEPTNKFKDINNQISEIQDSFSKIMDQAKPALDQIFSTTTKEVFTGAGNVVDQIISTSSSLSTTSDVVR